MLFVITNVYYYLFLSKFNNITVYFLELILCITTYNYLIINKYHLLEDILIRR